MKQLKKLFIITLLIGLYATTNFSALNFITYPNSSVEQLASDKDDLRNYT